MSGGVGWKGSARGRERIAYLLFNHITFVTNQNFIYGFSSMLFDVSDPVSNILRGRILITLC